MKPAVISICVTLLASLVFYLAGKPFDAADYAVSLVLCTLLVWTLEQYKRRPDENN